MLITCLCFEHIHFNKSSYEMDLTLTWSMESLDECLPAMERSDLMNACLLWRVASSEASVIMFNLKEIQISRPPFFI